MWDYQYNKMTPTSEKHAHQNQSKNKEEKKKKMLTASLNQKNNLWLGMQLSGRVLSNKHEALSLTGSCARTKLSNSNGPPLSKCIWPASWSGARRVLWRGGLRPPWPQLSRWWRVSFLKVSSSLNQSLFEIIKCSSIEYLHKFIRAYSPSLYHMAPPHNLREGSRA